MSFFRHEDHPNPTRGCKFLSSSLKGAFADCHCCSGKLCSLRNREDHSASDADDEQEEVVSEIRSRAMEAKSRRKASITRDSFSWIFSPRTGELFVTPKSDKNKEETDDGEEREDFFSVGSGFSRCSSARSSDAFVSVKTNFSRSSSLGSHGCRNWDSFLAEESWQGLDWEELRRWAIIQEFRHCKGWPFGLYRKALLLPPLPKCPSDSWTWRKGARLVKLP